MTIRISEQGIEWIKEDDGCVFRGNKIMRIKWDKQSARAPIVKTEALLNSGVSGRTSFSNYCK